jgi:hypothetical protein
MTSRDSVGQPVHGGLLDISGDHGAPDPRASEAPGRTVTKP